MLVLKLFFVYKTAEQCRLIASNPYLKKIILFNLQLAECAGTQRCARNGFWRDFYQIFIFLEVSTK